MRVLANGELSGLEDECPEVQQLLATLGSKWGLRVLLLLQGGAQRFNTLRRGLAGVTQRMLTVTLRGLERDGLVTRTVTPSRPPRVDYALTSRGRSLLGPLGVLARWASTDEP